MAATAPSADAADQTVVLDSDRRLMITNIVNENFKSYAGKKELGPFHKVNCPFHHNASACLDSKVGAGMSLLSHRDSPP